MRYPFDATGTIGSKPCEVSLNRILAELNNPGLTRAIMKCFNRCKSGLKALESMSDKHWAFCFKDYLQERCEQKIESITGIKVRGTCLKALRKDGPTMEAVTSHTMCCLHAYFAEFTKKLGPLDKQQRKTDGEEEVA